MIHHARAGWGQAAADARDRDCHLKRRILGCATHTPATAGAPLFPCQSARAEPLRPLARSPFPPRAARRPLQEITADPSTAEFFIPKAGDRYDRAKAAYAACMAQAASRRARTAGGKSAGGGLECDMTAGSAAPSELLCSSSLSIPSYVCHSSALRSDKWWKIHKAKVAADHRRVMAALDG